MLNNLLYIGEVPHKGKVYKGEHEAIIDRKLWKKTKKVTEAMCKATGFTKRGMASPFKGLLKCGYCGGAFGITYSQKKDRRYSYYFCVSDNITMEKFKCAFPGEWREQRRLFGMI